MTVPDSPSFVEVGGGFMQIIAGFVHDVGAVGVGLLLVLLVLAVKAAPLIALLSAVASALPPARCPRRRTGLAYLFAVAALLLAYLWLPAPPSLVHPTLGSVLPFLAVATVILAACRISWDLVHPAPPAPTAGKAIRSPSLAASKVITPPADGGDGDDPDELVTHRQIVDQLPPGIAADFGGIGATTPDSWVTRDETGATS
jgi:hypothetical protein